MDTTNVKRMTNMNMVKSITNSAALIQPGQPPLPAEKGRSVPGQESLNNGKT
jgi:hypothetical protein